MLYTIIDSLVKNNIVKHCWTISPLLTSTTIIFLTLFFFSIKSRMTILLFCVAIIDLGRILICFISHLLWFHHFIIDFLVLNMICFLETHRHTKTQIAQCNINNNIIWGTNKIWGQYLISKFLKGKNFTWNFVMYMDRRR